MRATRSFPPTPTLRDAFAAGLFLTLACATRAPSGLAGLCSGSPAAVTIEATIDSVRPGAGSMLMAARGEHFTMRFSFPPAAAVGASAASSDCAGRAGIATIAAELPAPLRNASSASRQATWRIEAGTVLLDLNPGTRDNNVFVSLPLHGGEGHWGLSTFAGEVASGRTAFVP